MRRRPEASKIETIIEIQDLHRRFGSHTVLRGLNLRVERGEVFGYLGPNGAGKTTTIRILLGLIRPTTGQALVFGEDTSNLRPETKYKIGSVLESPGLYDRLSAWDNLCYYGRIYRLSRSEYERRSKTLLRQVGLWSERRRKVGHFSLGMKRRLAIARALLHDPELLFLDEPTLGLDPEGSSTIRDLIVNLAQERKRTIFLTSHNLNLVEQICTRVGILHHGQLQVVGTVESLCYKSHSLEEIYLTTIGKQEDDA